MGILKSSGEYLMNLDSDDEINGYNSLEFLINQTIIYDVDIITFSIFDVKRNISINTCQCKNKTQKQPELFESIFNSNNNNIKDYFIWNKIIKRKIFKKAYIYFKKEIYNWKWNYFEDDIWNILVNRYATSKLCINRLVYIYNYNEDSLMNKRFGIIEFNNLLYRHEMYKKLFANKEDEKYLIAEYYFLVNRLNWEIKHLLLINDHKINSQITGIFNFFLKNYNCSAEYRKKMTNLIKLINN